MRGPHPRIQSIVHHAVIVDRRITLIKGIIITAEPVTILPHKVQCNLLYCILCLIKPLHAWKSGLESFHGVVYCIVEEHEYRHA